MTEHKVKLVLVALAAQTVICSTLFDYISWARLNIV